MTAKGLSLVLTIHTKDGDFEYSHDVRELRDALGEPPSIYGDIFARRSRFAQNGVISKRDDGQTTAKLALRLDETGALFPFLDGGRRIKKQGDLLRFENDGLTVVLDYKDVPSYITLPRETQDSLRPVILTRLDTVKARDTQRGLKRKAVDDLAQLKEKRRRLEEEQSALELKIAQLETEAVVDPTPLFLL